MPDRAKISSKAPKTIMKNIMKKKLIKQPTTNFPALFSIDYLIVPF